MVEIPRISTTEAAVGAGIVGVGIGVGAAALVSRRGKKSRRRKTSHRKVSRRHSRRSKGRRMSPHTAGKRKDTSRRRIRYTKNGQPYVIGAHGKARFIKKSSARSSFKRKGGRY